MSELENSSAGSVDTSSSSGGSESSSQESSAAQTPGSSQSQTPASGGTQSQVTAGAAGDSAAQTVVDDWKPNFKFKVKDKELEFGDDLKGLIKSKDLETKMRELHEKAYGLDEVKGTRDQVKQQLQAEQQKYGQVEQSLKVLGDYVQKKDFHSFFKALSIPKEDIIAYAIQELKYAELPADQKAQIDQQRQLQDQLRTEQSHSQQIQQQMSQLSVQQTNWELSQELGKPDVNQFANAYDTRVGKPGAFREEIIRRGQYYENVHKISPPVSQLVTEILNLAGHTPNPQGVGAIPQQNGQASQFAPNQQQPKPVIPSFAGASATKSPTKKVPTSIADLKQMRQDLQNRQG